ncbi:Putative succinyl-CoA transferase [Nocardioides aquaticus]|uniref:Succinyl-CoA transferase n=1 Tax=Nocardioides aquaticus TaxID=160826 RepID=A0ABX8EHE1_9ACTN|nr:GNAT family protein [Nocardioides aquaticus]QVT79932.1 Putative succinyl-CoA transferase [Nocardioides aquaticus]
MLSLEEIFPPFGLRVTSGPIELRVLRDDDLPELVDLVGGGVQPPEQPMPFLHDWHQQPFAPGAPDGFPTTSLAWWWTQRAQFAPAHWRLALTVRRDGELVGMQDLNARDFALTRHVETGSWLGLAHHGRGTGTLMRQLVVGFAFDELGALECGSGFIIGNRASAAVSRKTGYLENGQRRIVQHTRQGEIGVDEQRVVVTPATYVRQDGDVVIEGAEALRRFLAIDR